MMHSMLKIVEDSLKESGGLSLLKMMDVCSSVSRTIYMIVKSNVIGDSL